MATFRRYPFAANIVWLPAMVASAQVSADLSVGKAAFLSVTAGTEMNYSITVANFGPDDAQNLAFTDAAPPNIFFKNVAVTGPQAGNFVCGGLPATVRCSAATFAPGWVLVTITAIVNPNTPNLTLIANTATVGSTTPDPNTANNISTALTTVFAPTPTNTPTPVPIVPMLGDQGLLIFGLLIAAAGLLLLVRRR
jgi:uncharacterized repeat protein (TIGR01451 family)